MEKKQEATSQDATYGGDVFTNIRTFGVFTPNLDQVLDVDDIEVVIVIDKKKQKHLRVSYPTETLAGHKGGGDPGDPGDPGYPEDPEDTDLPICEKDAKGCWWVTECVGGGGDQYRVKKRCKRKHPKCNDKHETLDLGPC